jgi:taurine dioxygenase
MHNAVADYGPDEHRYIRRCQVMATHFYGEQGTRAPIFFKAT